MSNDHSSRDNYRPRSPDLSSFQPPPLPKLNRLPSYTQPPEPSFPPGFSFSPRASYDASPYFSPQTAQAPSYFSNQPHQQPQVQSPPQYHADLPPPGQSHQSFYPPDFRSPQSVAQHLPPAPQQVYDASQHFTQPFQSYESNDMARLRNRKQVNYSDDRHEQEFDAVPPVAYPSQHPLAPGPVAQMQPLQPLTAQPSVAHAHSAPPPVSTSHIDVRTKFPVARIKRIMQADEDVGKVAQATPTAVSKALEMFMIALVTKGAGEAKTQNSKRVTATHLKTALLSDPQFDFLNEICESVPDEGTKKGRAKSEAKSEDSDEDIGPRRKSKASSKRKKGDESDWSSSPHLLQDKLYNVPRNILPASINVATLRGGDGSSACATPAQAPSQQSIDALKVVIGFATAFGVCFQAWWFIKAARLRRRNRRLKEHNERLETDVEALRNMLYTHFESRV